MPTRLSTVSLDNNAKRGPAAATVGQRILFVKEPDGREPCPS